MAIDLLAAISLDPDTVHPLAAATCPEPFWYDSLDEASPLGSDQGSDIWLFFLDWCLTQPGTSALQFADRWIAEAGYRDALVEAEAATPEAIDPLAQLDAIRAAYPDWVAEWEAAHPDAGLDGLYQAFQPVDYGFVIREVYVATAIAQFFCQGRIDPELAQVAVEATLAELEATHLAAWGETAGHRAFVLRRVLQVLFVTLVQGAAAEMAASESAQK